MRRKKAPIVKGVPIVVDGDTLSFEEKIPGKGRRVRLADIDAPEDGQMCRDVDGELYDAGARAVGILEKKLRGQKVVRCEGEGYDANGRLLATCRVGRTNLNRWLVLQGYALAYRKYSTRYVPQEKAARKAKRGLWAGIFDPPWQWRRRCRERTLRGKASNAEKSSQRPPQDGLQTIIVERRRTRFQAAHARLTDQKRPVEPPRGRC